MFNSGSPAPSCTQFTWGASVKFNSTDKQMKTKFDILMACRDGVIHFCVISPLLIHLSCVALVLWFKKSHRKTLCSRTTTNSHVDLWPEVINRQRRFYSWAHLKVVQYFCKICKTYKKLKTKKQCLPERVQSDVVQTSSVRKWQNKWSTVKPKLLRSVVLSRENKSSFLPKSSVLLKYLCYFIICGMCDGKGWTQVSAHRSANTNKSLLNIPVVLSRQLTHCPITGCKILDTRYWLLGSAVRPWRPSLSPICSNIKSVSLLKIYNE